jgi:hypothetical protein
MMSFMPIGRLKSLIFLIGLGIPTGIVLTWLSVNSFKGLDLSDEGMYLLSAATDNPKAAFHNPFGTYTGLLLDISLGRIFLFRILGLLLLTGAGIQLGISLARFLSTDNRQINLIIVGFAGSSIAFFYYATGLITPSYNWLNLLSLILGATTCIKIADRKIKDHSRLFGIGCILSLSLLLGLFAKFSSSIGILLLVTIIFWFSGRSSKDLKFLFYGTATAFLSLMILHQLFIESWSLSYQKFSQGQTALQILDPIYETSTALKAFRSDFVYWFNSMFKFSNLILISVLNLFILSLFQYFYKKSHVSRIVETGFSFCAVALIAYAFGRAYSQDLWAGHSGLYVNQMWAVSWLLLCGFLITVPLWFLQSSGINAFVTVKRQIVVTLVLLGCACLYAIGSGNGFLRQLTGSSGFFLLLAICLPLSFSTKSGVNVAMSIALAGLIGAVETTHQANLYPYRQESRKVQSVWISAGTNRGKILVAPDLAKTVTELRDQLAKSDWSTNTPLLDFTWYSAGLVFLLEAQAPITVIPTVGGYSTVNELMEWSIRQALLDNAAEWKEAWLLTNSDGVLHPEDGRPDTSAVALLGRVFPNDYQVVAQTPHFSIWKPVRK